MPEKEYISIQKLLELKNNIFDYGHYDLGDLDMFLEDIKEHFVDAVEVVRCKECAHRYTPARCALWVGTENGKDIFLERGENFSCSYGERKNTDDTK